MDAEYRARLQAEIYAARGAQEILGNPAYRAAEERALADIVSDWQQSRDATVREQLWAAQKGIDVMRAALQALVERAVLAQAEIDADI